jgi:hypothetical protein
VAQGIGLEFKPQYHKKKNRERHSDVNIDAVLKVFHLITTFLVLLGKINFVECNLKRLSSHVLTQALFVTAVNK